MEGSRFAGCHGAGEGLTATMAPQREWFEKDYYAILGVSKSATPKEVTKAYRKLARELHPDANPGNAASEERFKEVSTAYDVLGDETKRKEYDEVRAAGPMGFGGGGPGGPGGFRFDTGGDGIGDLLGQMFGRGANRRGGANVGPQRGGDIEASLTLDFADAVHGITTTLHLTSEAVCTSCNGSGARAGTTPKTCSQCGGRGAVDANQGVFSFSSPCQRCQGRGVTIEYPCGSCRGSGTEHRAREVKVRIPAGVDNGQRIRLKGRGAPGRNGGPAGDLFVECRVAPHATFGRDGLNLLVRVPVAYHEAVLGSDIDVPTLDGTPVMLKLKAGTQSGTKHRVKGRGIETATHKGDLIVTIDVAIPIKPTAEEKRIIEELASVASVPRQPRAGSK